MVVALLLMACSNRFVRKRCVFGHWTQPEKNKIKMKLDSINNSKTPGKKNQRLYVSLMCYLLIIRY